MPGNYLDRLKEAEELAKRARNDRERVAFDEIASIWRRLAEGPAPNPEKPT